MATFFDLCLSDESSSRQPWFVRSCVIVLGLMLAGSAPGLWCWIEDFFHSWSEGLSSGEIEKAVLSLSVIGGFSLMIWGAWEKGTFFPPSFRLKELKENDWVLMGPLLFLTFLFLGGSLISGWQAYQEYEADREFWALPYAFFGVILAALSIVCGYVCYFPLIRHPRARARGEDPMEDVGESGPQE